MRDQRSGSDRIEFEQQVGAQAHNNVRGAGTSAFYKCPPSMEITKTLPKTVTLV